VGYYYFNTKQDKWAEREDGPKPGDKWLPYLSTVGDETCYGTVGTAKSGATVCFAGHLDIPNRAYELTEERGEVLAVMHKEESDVKYSELPRELVFRDGTNGVTMSLYLPHNKRSILSVRATDGSAHLRVEGVPLAKYGELVGHYAKQAAHGRSLDFILNTLRRSLADD
jgi:hypothetical protein